MTWSARVPKNLQPDKVTSAWCFMHFNYYVLKKALRVKSIASDVMTVYLPLSIL
jgi:hypothetical protein